jgi:hypothetical protein
VTQTHLPPHWQGHLLRSLGALVGHENVRLLTAWQQAEGGTARWNPLNTTFDLPGATDYNSVGVKNYPRPTWGVYATGLTLTSPASGPLTYGKILGHLQAGSSTAEQIVSDCRDEFQTWGTNPDAILAVLKETP